MSRLGNGYSLDNLIMTRAWYFNASVGIMEVPVVGMQTHVSGGDVLPRIINGRFPCIAGMLRP